MRATVRRLYTVAEVMICLRDKYGCPSKAPNSDEMLLKFSHFFYNTQQQMRAFNLSEKDLLGSPDSEEFASVMKPLEENADFYVFMTRNSPSKLRERYADLIKGHTKSETKRKVKEFVQRSETFERVSNSMWLWNEKDGENEKEVFMNDLQDIDVHEHQLIGAGILDQLVTRMEERAYQPRASRAKTPRGAEPDRARTTRAEPSSSGSGTRARKRAAEPRAKLEDDGDQLDYEAISNYGSEDSEPEEDHVPPDSPLVISASGPDILDIEKEKKDCDCSCRREIRGFKNETTGKIQDHFDTVTQMFEHGSKQTDFLQRCVGECTKNQTIELKKDSAKIVTALENSTKKRIGEVKTQTQALNRIEREIKDNKDEIKQVKEMVDKRHKDLQLQEKEMHKKEEETHQKCAEMHEALKTICIKAREDEKRAKAQSNLLTKMETKMENLSQKTDKDNHAATTNILLNDIVKRLTELKKTTDEHEKGLSKLTRWGEDREKLTLNINKWEKQALQFDKFERWALKADSILQTAAKAMDAFVKEKLQHDQGYEKWAQEAESTMKATVKATDDLNKMRAQPAPCPGPNLPPLDPKPYLATPMAAVGPVIKGEVVATFSVAEEEVRSPAAKVRKIGPQDALLSSVGGEPEIIPGPGPGFEWEVEPRAAAPTAMLETPPPEEVQVQSGPPVMQAQIKQEVVSLEDQQAAFRVRMRDAQRTMEQTDFAMEGEPIYLACDETLGPSPEPGSAEGNRTLHQRLVNGVQECAELDYQVGPRGPQ